MYKELVIDNSYNLIKEEELFMCKDSVEVDEERENAWLNLAG